MRVNLNSSKQSRVFLFCIYNKSFKIVSHCKEMKTGLSSYLIFLFIILFIYLLFLFVCLFCLTCCSPFDNANYCVILPWCRVIRHRLVDRCRCVILKLVSGECANVARQLRYSYKYTVLNREKQTVLWLHIIIQELNEYFLL